MLSVSREHRAGRGDAVGLEIKHSDGTRAADLGAADLGLADLGTPHLRHAAQVLLKIEDTEGSSEQELMYEDKTWVLSSSVGSLVEGRRLERRDWGPH